MSTVASPSRARKVRAPKPAPAPSPAPSEPVARHGTCALWLSIGGTRYKLRPLPPRGDLAVIWTLSKVQPDPLREPVAYAVASDGREAHCTCPDHVKNGATCKHIAALRSLRLIPPAVAEAAAPPVAPAPPVAAPVPRPNARIEEGWQPGGKAPAQPPAPSPSPEAQAEGFRQAVRQEIRRKRGETGACHICESQISPDESYSPAGAPLLCGDCFEEGGAL